MPETDLRANGPALARGLVFGGAVLTLLGVLLPWVEVDVFFGRVVVSGLDTNPGKLALAAAIFAGLLTIVAAATDDPAAKRIFPALCVAPGIAIAFLAAFNLQDVSGLDSIGGPASAEVGAGLWVTLLGGLLVLAGGLVSLRPAPAAPGPGGPAQPFTLPGSVPYRDKR
jgi:hypothetical protein